jgi:hypothetical protein
MVAVTRRSPISGPWPITLALGVAIGGLVTVAVLAVLVVQWQSSRTNVLELINDNVRRTFRAVEVTLEGHLQPATAQIDYLGGLMEAGRYDPAEHFLTAAYK